MREGHDFRVVPTRPLIRSYSFTNEHGIRIDKITKYFIGIAMDAPRGHGGLPRRSEMIQLSREHSHYRWYPVSADCHQDLLDSLRRPSWVHSVIMEGAEIVREWIYNSVERPIELIAPDWVSGSICCICQQFGATWGAVHNTHGVHIIACTACVDAQGGATGFRLRLGSPPKCPRCREIVVRVDRIFT